MKTGHRDTNKSAHEHAENADLVDGIYTLQLRAIWDAFKQEHFSFWVICAYLFVEYVRPQSIIPALDILPWGKLFIVFAFIARLFDRRAKWVSHAANFWMTAFLFVILLSSITATYSYISWDHFMDYFGWYLIYFLIINIVTNERRLYLFVLLFLLTSFKLSLFGARIWATRGFAFTSWGIMGPPGFFENSGELSIQMLMFSPIAYELTLFSKPYISAFKYYFLLLLPITGAMTVMGASSRGSQVGLVYQAYRTLLKGRASLKTLLIVAAVLALGWGLLPEEQKGRFASAGHDTTSQQRLLYWKHGIEMIKDHPFLGVGYFNFSRYFSVHWPQDVIRGPRTDGEVAAELPHNIFVQVGTDSGLIGLAIFATLLWQNAKTARKIVKCCEQNPLHQKPFLGLAKGLLIAMWGFIIAGQFVTVTYYPFFWINLALTVALGNISDAHFKNTAAVSDRQGARTQSKVLASQPSSAR